VTLSGGHLSRVIYLLRVIQPILDIPNQLHVGFQFESQEVSETDALEADDNNEERVEYICVLRLKVPDHGITVEGVGIGVGSWPKQGKQFFGKLGHLHDESVSDVKNVSFTIYPATLADSKIGYY
jgi:hypothetical protein